MEVWPVLYLIVFELLFLLWRFQRSTNHAVFISPTIYIFFKVSFSRSFPLLPPAAWTWWNFPRVYFFLNNTGIAGNSRAYSCSIKRVYPSLCANWLRICWFNWWLFFELDSTRIKAVIVCKNAPKLKNYGMGVLFALAVGAYSRQR